MVSRVRKVSVPSQQEEHGIPRQGEYRGFGSVPGETLEQFHERMFDLPPLEAMAYEMEVTLREADLEAPPIN